MIQAECPICHLEFNASAGSACPGCGHKNLIVKGEVADEAKDDPAPNVEEKTDEPAANVSIG